MYKTPIINVCSNIDDVGGSLKRRKVIIKIITKDWISNKKL